jgi:hypothetical protein
MLAAICSYWISWRHHFKSFTIATMTWLTVTEYKWPRTCSILKRGITIHKSTNTKRNCQKKNNKRNSNDIQDTMQKTNEYQVAICSYWRSWRHHFKSFTIATMTWLTVTEYKWPQKCSTIRNHSPIISSFVTYYRVCS